MGLWRLREGLWLGLTLASQPYSDLKKLGEGSRVGGVEGRVAVGEAVAQPGTERLAWKSLCPRQLGSDRALIQVLYKLRVFPLL